MCAISCIHLPHPCVLIALRHLILEQAQDALEEIFKWFLLMLHRVDEVLELVHISLESIYTNFFHCFSFSSYN